MIVRLIGKAVFRALQALQTELTADGVACTGTAQVWAYQQSTMSWGEIRWALPSLY